MHMHMMTIIWLMMDIVYQHVLRVLIVLIVEEKSKAGDEAAKATVIAEGATKKESEVLAMKAD